LPDSTVDHSTPAVDLWNTSKTEELIKKESGDYIIEIWHELAYINTGVEMNARTSRACVQSRPEYSLPKPR